MMMYNQNLVAKGTARFSRNSHILITWALIVTFTLKLACQSFCMFGYKRLQKTSSGQSLDTRTGRPLETQTDGHSDSNRPSPPLKSLQGV